MGRFQSADVLLVLEVLASLGHKSCPALYVVIRLA
jgi:hypothetical protein